MHTKGRRDGATSVGALLRRWRLSRGRSQLDLALEAGVSPRHLSCVETSKAQPSRDLLEALANVLGVPLRERNALYVAAGYAPPYRETDLSAPGLGSYRQAIGLILEHQSPYPAFVTNRYWDVLLTNRPLEALFAAIKAGAVIHPNILRQVFDPDDMRPLIANWDEVARDLLQHLHHEVAGSPSDTKLRGLLDEVMAYSDVPQHWRFRDLGAMPQPVMTTHFFGNGLNARFFSTLTSFGPSRDITLAEVRIECMFPADDETARLCAALARGMSA